MDNGLELKKARREKEIGKRGKILEMYENIKREMETKKYKNEYNKNI